MSPGQPRVSPSMAPHPPCRRASLGLALAGLATLLLGLAFVPPAWAHPLAPSLLRLEVRADQTVAMTWRTPTSRLVGSSQQPLLPPSCRPLGPVTDTLVSDGNAIERRAIYDCAPTGLVGQRVGVSGLAASGTDSIVHITLSDGRQVQRLLHASAPSLSVPAAQSALEVALDYLRLGLHHLFTGLDHVAFILGLLLLVRGRRRLLTAITAFTLGHSLTLALAALGLVHLPQSLVEICIAASIVALGVEALQSAGAASPGPIARHPAVLCVAFGLVHGLGFAGALAETGLPQGAIAPALLAFNVGIELGQLGIVAVVALLGALARAYSGAAGLGLAPRLALATLVGSAGAFWLLQRALVLAGVLSA